MPVYMWRVPTLLGVMACSAVVLFAAAIASWTIVRRRRSVILDVLIATTLVLLLLLTVAATRVTVASIARTLEISVFYIDPGFFGYLGPAMFAAFGFLVARRVLEDVWCSYSALLFYLWFVGFTGANVVNWCSPGWCETIGFPFVWRSWSDAIGFDDPFREVKNAIAGALNLLTFAALSGVLTRLRTAKQPK